MSEWLSRLLSWCRELRLSGSTSQATETEEEPLTPYEIELLKGAADHKGELSLDTSFMNQPYPCICTSSANVGRMVG